MNVGLCKKKCDLVCDVLKSNVFLVSLDDWISLTCSTVLFFQEGILVELRGVIFLRLLSTTKA